MTDQRRVDLWSDEEIERMAASDPDHPALDDEFWRLTDQEATGERSFEKIEAADLERLADRAVSVLNRLARSGPDRPSGRARPHLLLLALAQGAAQHFVDGRNGIKDFDVWAFFDDAGAGRFPHRPVWNVDFGPSRFGVHPADADAGYEGRRVDVMGRSIRSCAGASPTASVQDWLRSARTESSRLLAARPVIAIYPEAIRGTTIWPNH